MQPPGFYNGLTPNSTINGDAARLSSYAGLVNADAGAFATKLNAMGTFNLNRAQAEAIDNATMMKWNEYFWACVDEENRRSRVGPVLSGANDVISLYNDRRERDREQARRARPTQWRRAQCAPRAALEPQDPSVKLEKAGRDDPGETIQRCAFRYPSVGMTISLGRLTVRDGWPLALRGKAFARERAAYQKAMETALEQNLEGKLTPEAFKSLQADCRGPEGYAQGDDSTL